MRKQRFKVQATFASVFVVAMLTVGISSPAGAQELPQELGSAERVLPAPVTSAGENVTDSQCDAPVPDFGEVDPQSLEPVSLKPDPPYLPVLGGIESVPASGVVTTAICVAPSSGEGQSADISGPSYHSIVGGLDETMNIATFGLEIGSNGPSCLACDGCHSGRGCEDPEIPVDLSCGSCGSDLCLGDCDDDHHDENDTSVSRLTTPDAPTTYCDDQDCIAHPYNGYGIVADGPPVAIDETIIDRGDPAVATSNSDPSSVRPIAQDPIVQDWVDLDRATLGELAEPPVSTSGFGEFDPSELAVVRG